MNKICYGEGKQNKGEFYLNEDTKMTGFRFTHLSGSLSCIPGQEFLWQCKRQTAGEYFHTILQIYDVEFTTPLTLEKEIIFKLKTSYYGKKGERLFIMYIVNTMTHQSEIKGPNCVVVDVIKD